MMDKLVESIAQGGAMGAVAGLLILYLGRKVDALHAELVKLCTLLVQHIERSETERR